MQDGPEIGKSLL